MVRRSKNSRNPQPNAPEFTIGHQPPHNPYYFDPSAISLSSPPPPYSELTVPLSSTMGLNNQAVPMRHINNSSGIAYHGLDQSARPGHASVVIHGPGEPYDRRAERYNRKVKSFNNKTILIALLTILLSLWSYKIFDNRPCIYGITILKQFKDVTISIKEVRDFHLCVALVSCLLLILCLVKATTGWKSRSYPCYLFMVIIVTFITSFYTGYLAYLSFYSPCVAKPGEVLAGVGKTLLGSFVDHLPAPDKGLFGESSVFSLAKEDNYGLMIFFFDLINFILYLSVFLNSTTMLLC